MSYEGLLVKCKELENEVIILKCQQKPVVNFNKETGNFEYQGEPIPLFDGKQNQQEITDIEEFVECLKAWLSRKENQSLSVRSIFESLDRQNFGELKEPDFDLALKKVGVLLRADEKKLLKNVLEANGTGYLKYRPLLNEISGIPQLDFVIPEVSRLARNLVETRDLNEDLFKQLVDPTRIEMMTLEQLKEAFDKVRNDQFHMGSEEVESLFKKVTRSQRTIGVHISISKLTEKVFKALDAHLVNVMRDHVSKAMKSLQEMFSRQDDKKQGSIDYEQLAQLFLECGLVFKDRMFNRVC